jgi:hypothetical protein
MRAAAVRSLAHSLAATTLDPLTRAGATRAATLQGTGFPLAERDRLGIRGLVPPRVLDIEAQATKARHAHAAHAMTQTNAHAC